MATTPNTSATLLGLDSENADLLRFLGETGYHALGVGRHELAGQLFGLVRAFDPDEPAGFLGGAEEALADQRWREAEAMARHASRAVADRTTTAMGYVLLARALSGRGKQDPAAAAIEAAIEIDPDGPAGRLARAERRTKE